MRRRAVGPSSRRRGAAVGPGPIVRRGPGGLALAAVLSALAAGCGGPTRCAPATYSGGPTVELGSTDGPFVGLRDGQPVTVVHGIQGGFHVWGAVRTRFLDPSAMVAHFTLGLDDGSAPVTARDDVFDLDGGCDGTQPGTHVATAVFLPDPAALRGRSCRFSVTVTDLEGRSASDARRVVPVDPAP